MTQDPAGSAEVDHLDGTGASLVGQPPNPGRAAPEYEASGGVSESPAVNFPVYLGGKRREPEGTVGDGGALDRGRAGERPGVTQEGPVARANLLDLLELE